MAGQGKHTHYSSISAVGIFLVVVILGSAWRLTAYRLCASGNQMAQNFGAAMAFQF